MVKSVFQFYKSFAFASNLISLICCSLIVKNGLSIIIALLLFKAVTSVIIYFYTQNSRKEQFYFYHNLGISAKKLWTASLLIDLSIFIPSLLFAYYFLSCTALK